MIALGRYASQRIFVDRDIFSANTPVMATRFTNGMRAGLCALVLVGVRFNDACAIVGISRRRLGPEHLGDDWRGVQRRSLYTPAKRAEIRKAWESGLPHKEMERLFDISPSGLRKMARHYGWRTFPRGVNRSRFLAIGAAVYPPAAPARPVPSSHTPDGART